MKRMTIMAVLLAISTALCSCEKEEIVTETGLPAVSREFISHHFPDAEITMAIKDSEAFSTDYTVYLSNGFEIDFTKSGDWDDVDGKRTAIPESILDILPKGIPDYVTNTLNGHHYIVEVNKERYGYEIGLSNGMELKFDSKGKFLSFDD
jgi:hypothetical protein